MHLFLCDTSCLPTRFLFLFVFYFIWRALYVASLRYPKIRISFPSDLSCFKTERKLHLEISVLPRSNWDKSMLRYFYVRMSLLRHVTPTICIRFNEVGQLQFIYNYRVQRGTSVSTRYKRKNQTSVTDVTRISRSMRSPLGARRFKSRKKRMQDTSRSERSSRWPKGFNRGNLVHQRYTSRKPYLNDKLCFKVSN